MEVLMMSLVRLFVSITMLLVHLAVYKGSSNLALLVIGI
jgi:hypothetical protein